MTTSSTPSGEGQPVQPVESVEAVQPGTPRDAAYWAQQASTFKVTRVPTGALNLNVDGRQALSPLQGFGQMWQKTYRVPLVGATVTPAEVIKVWKENFPKFWPKGNRFYAPLTGIAPGEVGIINMQIPGGIPLSTGVLVLYADDESFTFMTPQGHVFSGWITFCAFEDDGCTVAQAQLLIRAFDPIYEIGFRLGASRGEDKFWIDTLQSLEEYFGVHEPVQVQKVLIDPRVQWSQVGNVWQNSAIRTTMYKMIGPVRWMSGRRRR